MLSITSGKSPDAMLCRFAAELCEPGNPDPYSLSGAMFTQRPPHKGCVRANGSNANPPDALLASVLVQRGDSGRVAASSP